MPSEDFSPNLNLPYLLPNQAQKHVTVNESLRAFDVLVMASVEETGLDAPPAVPAEGQVWSVGAAPSDAWAGHAGELAAWQDGAWMFYPPQAGWRVWDRLNSSLVIFDGTNWTVLEMGSGSGSGDTQNLEFVGLATTGDSANPFAARLNAALWTARETSDGGSGDLRLSINKEDVGNTGSILFQSGYSGRAEIGLVGDDQFSFRVSSDGAAWSEALQFHRNSGFAGLGGPPLGTNQLAIHGRVFITAASGYCLLNPKGRLDLASTSGGTVFVQAESNGSALSFGVTNSAGVFNDAALELRPDDEEMRSAFDVTPEVSGARSLGQAGRVWQDLFVQNAPTVASDARGKVDICDLDGAVELIAGLRPVSYRRPERDALHFGFVAQDVRRALDDLSYGEVGLWTQADSGDEDSRQALRQEELIAVLVSAVQALSSRVAMLERAEA